MFLQSLAMANCPHHHLDLTHPMAFNYRFLLLSSLFCIEFPAHAASWPALSAEAARIEAQLPARLGVALLDADGQTLWSQRGDERFALNSTFKAFACAAMLDRAGRGELDRAARMVVQGPLPAHSPVTERHLGQTLSLDALCQASMAVSDNGAANLVLRALGGPAGLTAFWRQHGDGVSRLDRWEPELNEAVPGDVRDTTTPLAAARGVWALALGPGLAGPAQRTWLDWLSDNQLSGSLLRAGVPVDWRVADRSGAGGHGSRSIVAVLWPPQRAPLILAVYLTGTTAGLAVRDAAIAGLGRALAQDMAAVAPQGR